MARLRIGIGALVSVIAFIVYIFTTAPSVSFIDSGELTSVCATLGIAHPTGYPIYTLLGRLCLLLPLPFNKSFQLNLLSALLVAVAVYVVYSILFHLQTHGITLKSRDEAWKKIIPFVHATSAATALVLGFSKTFWTQALVAEVYPLHILFVLAVLFVFLRATGSMGTELDRKRSVKYYFLFAFLFGLGMANHMTMIVLVPASLYLMISKEGMKRFLVVAYTNMIPAFLLGISSYLYLPVRSAVQPVLDWGNPETISNLFRHLSGRQYQVWMFSSFDVAATQLSAFVKTLPMQFTPFLFPLTFIGLWKLYRYKRRFLWFTMIIFVSNLLYSINYDIHDIESYFLPCFIVTALWIGFGMVQTGEFIRSRFRSVHYFAVGIVLLLPLLPFAMNYTEVDRSGDYFVHDYTQNFLKGVGEGGIVISRQWDFFCSPLYYFQYVEGVRSDVVLIEQELLRRSWYYPQLQRQYPWLLQASQEEVNDFLVELEKFEKDKPYDPVHIQRTYIQMIDSFIEKHIDSRSVYITPEVEGTIGSKFVKVPEGLAYRLYRDDRLYSFEKPEYVYRGLGARTSSDYFHRTIISFYSNMLTTRGTYLSRYGQCAEAVEFFRETLGIDPTNQQAQMGLKKCETTVESGTKSGMPQ